MCKLKSSGRLARAGLSPLRMIVPLVLANVSVAYTSFWLSLVSDTARFGCFDTSNFRDAVDITVTILPLALLIKELECFLDNVREGHRHRTVATAGGVSVLKWIAASTCAVCGLLSSWTALKFAEDNSQSYTLYSQCGRQLCFVVCRGSGAVCHALRPCGLAARGSVARCIPRHCCGRCP